MGLFLNLLVDDFQRGEKIPQEQDQERQGQHEHLEEERGETLTQGGDATFWFHLWWFQSNRVWMSWSLSWHRCTDQLTVFSDW